MSVDTDIKKLAAQVVAAFVEQNSLPASELPGLITSIYVALNGAAQPAPDVAKPAQIIKLTPAQIRKLVSPAGIRSLEDGRIYKSMKLHLTRYGLTPTTYREKWGLPSDFPTVSPNYSAARSAMAKSLGLGRRAAVEPAPAPVGEPAKPARAVRAKGQSSPPSNRAPKAIAPADETFT